MTASIYNYRTCVSIVPRTQPKPAPKPKMTMAEYAALENEAMRQPGMALDFGAHSRKQSEEVSARERGGGRQALVEKAMVGNVTVKDLEKATGLTRREIHWCIGNMRNQGRVKIVGTQPTGRGGHFNVYARIQAND